MFASVAGVALALQLGALAHPLNESIPSVQEILTQEILTQEILAREIRYRRAATATISMSGTASATRTGRSRRAFNRAGTIPWNTAAAVGRYPAVMAPTAIFAMGSATRRARCQCSIRKAARAIIIDETATSKCDSGDAEHLLAEQLLSRGGRCRDLTSDT
jgi:hypothetical protein